MPSPKLREKYAYGDGEKKQLMYYYAEFYDRRCQPVRRRISLGTKNEAAATLKFAKMVEEYHRGDFDPWHDSYYDESMTVQKAVQLYLGERSSEWAESTYETTEAVLRTFYEGLPVGYPVYGVQASDVTEYIEERDLALATKQTHQARLRTFFKWCVEQRLLKDNPVPDNGNGKVARSSSVPKFLREGQYQRLIEYIEKDAVAKNLSHGNRWLLDAIEFALGTGLRRGELCALRWAAIDLEFGMITVQATKDFSPKSGRERRVPLVGRARKVVERLRADGAVDGELVFRGATGGPMGENYLSQRFRFYRRQAGIPEGISFHSLRHTFASWFVQRGGDLYRLKEIMGHADIKTTLKYASLSPDALVCEMQKCFGE
jgi:integrase